MKKIELGIGLSLIVPLVLMAMHIDPGVLLTVILSATAMFYVYFSEGLFRNLSFQESLRERAVRGRKMSIARFSGFPVAVVCLGILFKLQFWPGYENQLLFGVAGVVLVGVFAIWKYDSAQEVGFRGLFMRLAVFALLGIGMMLTPRENILEMKHAGHPEFVEAVKQSWADPENQELQQKVRQERDRLKDL